jgi:hypothetical protein
MILPVFRNLVAGNGWVDGAGPGVDAASEGLGVIEALIAEPHGYAEGAGSVVAEDYDGGVGVEFLMGARCYFSHGHKQSAGKAGGLVLPRLADIQEDGSIGLLT